jgi:hypothetical protein
MKDLEIFKHSLLPLQRQIVTHVETIRTQSIAIRWGTFRPNLNGAAHQQTLQLTAIKMLALEFIV